jgi:hypothetical protein
MKYGLLEMNTGLLGEVCSYEYSGLFSGKRGAGTHKRGKDKHTESFVTISL